MMHTLSKRTLFYLVVVGVTVSCQSNQMIQGKKDARSSIRQAVVYQFLPEFLQSDFKHCPLLIISGKIGETVEIAGMIDDMTRMIRRELILQLSKTKGVIVVQRHKLKHLDTPGQTIDLNCGDYIEPGCYLILDASIVKDLVYVNTAIVEKESPNTITSGSGMEFSFDLTPQVLTLQENTSRDEYLEGTKYLPVQPGEKDAAAEYLASSLVCLLESRIPIRRCGFFIEENHLQGYEKGIVQLMRGYLPLFGLSVVDRVDDATHIMIPSATPSGEDTILWVKVKDLEDKKYVTSTRVYYKKKDLFRGRYRNSS